MRAGGASRSGRALQGPAWLDFIARVKKTGTLPLLLAIPSPNKLISSSSWLGHPHTGLLPGTYDLLPAVFLGDIAAACPLLNSLPSVNPPLTPLALRLSHLCSVARYRALYIALRPPRAPASVLLAACLPPAARNANWCRSRSRLVSPTHHSASCHPPLTPSPVPPLSPTIAHYSAAFYASATLTAECWLLPLLHA